MKYKKIMGVDIGGSGIKGCPVDTRDGRMLAQRHRIPTPSPATSDAIAGIIKRITRHYHWQGPVGCGFPGVIQDGIARMVANLDDSCVDVNLEKLFSKTAGLPVKVVNDADAAGMAEMKFGAGKKQRGVVLLLTIGTGIGAVMFVNGRLVPNLELGHLELKGLDAEEYCSDAVRKSAGMTWEEWAGRFDEYLHVVEDLIWPDLIILGGGISKKGGHFLKHLTVRTRVVPAELLNNAGLVGAALAARYQHKLQRKSYGK